MNFKYYKRFATELKMQTQTLESILDDALMGKDISSEDGVFLLKQKHRDAIAAIRETSDRLRQRQAGEIVTYVVNRNINFTNICEQHCNFCAFRRDAGQDGAYWLDWGQILAKTTDAVERGATEICLQGGLNPEAKIEGKSLSYYLRVVETIKSNFPQIHLHAFSPQEIQFIAREDNISYAVVIQALQAAGVNSLPGTAAEVLCDRVRRIICPEKINTETWLEIIETAHQLGMYTTSTMLSGHIETPEQQMIHLQHLRNLQQKAIRNNYPAKFSEFVLLPFVGQFAPPNLRRRVGREQPDLHSTLQLTAVARIYLGNWLVNHQPSWVKLGLKGAMTALKWGCNDIGGTLMEEHITTMAGAKGGTNMTVECLQKAILACDRLPRERTTLYQLSINN
jgi:FO synthase subunit 2